MPVISVVSPVSPNSHSTCGYCSLSGERSKSASSVTQTAAVAIQLSCDVYQRMIDRGWRRSGTYCYKPDMRRTCCPQYTIKLDTLQFSPSKSQRKLVNRFNTFIIDRDASDAMDVDASTLLPKRKQGKAGKTEPFSLVDAIHASEVNFMDGIQPKHRFEVTLEPSSFSKEKYALYEDYQKNIHLATESSPQGFKQFLVDTPLHNEPIPYTSSPPTHLPLQYGSYHQMYRLDGELIAIGVLDILPGCVSSVYFMYNKKHEKHSLGKLSALRETSLVREMAKAGAPGLDALYMGFYIHSCPKMRYKGEYSPSYLVDPETYGWYPLEKCTKLLDLKRYACFSESANSRTTVPTDVDELAATPVELLRKIKLVKNIEDGQLSVVAVDRSIQWKDKRFKAALEACFKGFGEELSQEIVFNVCPMF